MAIYTGPTGTDQDMSIPVEMMRSLGPVDYDINPEANPNGVTSLTPRDHSEGSTFDYIPYSNKPINWHTDGYYNGPDKTVKSLILHCVSQASNGGENKLLDHEIAFILLMDENPEYIQALMDINAMTIPARIENGKVMRADSPGPVFMTSRNDSALHMRYTHRTRSIIWSDTATGSASALRRILEADSPYIFTGLLQPGWGLACNNVLHTREPFSGDEIRLLYRIRYFDYIPHLLE